MGLFGNLFGNNRTSMQPPYQGSRGPIDPAFQPPTPPADDPSRHVFGHGVGGVLGGLAKIATYGPFVGMAQDGMNRRHDREGLEDAYKRATIQHMGQTEEPSVIRTAKAIGLTPGTPEFTKFVTDATMAPRYMMMGSPETGQTIVNPNAPPAMSGPPQEAIDRLRTNPGEAAQFDEIFGPGASQRALAGGR